jgi:hypothetical protein
VIEGWKAAHAAEEKLEPPTPDEYYAMRERAGW